MAITPIPAITTAKLAVRHDDVLRRHRINPFPLAGADRGREIARLAREAMALGAVDDVVGDTVAEFARHFAADASDGLGDLADPRLADLECFIAERGNVVHAVLGGRDARPVMEAEITIWLLTTTDGEEVIARARDAFHGRGD